MRGNFARESNEILGGVGTQQLCSFIWLTVLATVDAFKNGRMDEYA